MNNIRGTLLGLFVFVFAVLSAGCGNTHVSGSMSYSTGMGYGYPMYYGPRGHRHTDIIVVKPPKKRTRPSRSKPKPVRRR